MTKVRAEVVAREVLGGQDIIAPLHELIIDVSVALAVPQKWYHFVSTVPIESALG